MARKQKSSASNLLEVQNAAKTLFANIRFQSVDKPIRTIVMTSAVPDEGKTTVSWYLAQAIATAGHSVLLVEADMRRRSLARMLQLHPEHGIFSVLSNSVSLRRAVVSTSVANLFFLDSEPSIPNPADLLASNSMRQLNERLMELFEYVIFDTPPVGTFIDAAVLGAYADASILVVRAGRSKRSELQLAYEQMENAGANIIGLCATFVQGTGSEYYYSYYTKGSRRSEEKLAASQTPAAMRSGETREAPLPEISIPPKREGGFKMSAPRSTDIPSIAPGYSRQGSQQEDARSQGRHRG